MVGYLDKFAPHHFHSAREHRGQVGCTYQKKKRKKKETKDYNSQNFIVSLHAYFKCLRVNKVNL